MRRRARRARRQGSDVRSQALDAPVAVHRPQLAGRTDRPRRHCRLRRPHRLPRRPRRGCRGQDRHPRRRRLRRPAAALDRFCARYESLPDAVRRRLVLENDEISYPVVDTLAIHQRTGIPLVFDILHHRVNNPAGLSPADACRRCLATWPPAETPKIHYSSHRQADRDIVRRHRATNERRTSRIPAKAGQHDDWIDPDDFLAFLNGIPDRRFDVMLEAKQKDLALLRLRDAIADSGLQHRIW